MNKLKTFLNNFDPTKVDIKTYVMLIVVGLTIVNYVSIALGHNSITIDEDGITGELWGLFMVCGRIRIFLSMRLQCKKF